ncbi:50S ribosomal protein L6 [Liquorilactobacillus nagelii]|uniref:Large ribosomal subunit protein uL6 n=1 Tax=Liquorilactobacillus nagelii TaxID=82688 RepID=A0A3S6QTA1_9LACO|nr:50S ribosomal protein L6 [Liquorilactobacillus nagelii]AUJ31324.1 50S ribosomal protein L6 [Liquorilactobacillus nagelii]KRL40364.1 50S ribosomal protein L6P [Liquorilactobacillus nagelii DSM 13675]MCC7616865.1 50S ribosomal protein L6 [Liquorilactobacillus nagelii]MCI1633470.1 50S ribosomal protein L6 [Liquorilactobacillus nagelii]MCI1700329.1 50S ribosomal protein L6 [Liquorilactobacillus nagelii]
MSRIGYKEVVLPAGVEVKRNGYEVTVKGPKGELTREFSDKISMNIEGNIVKFDRSADDSKTKALHGTTRANFHNMVVGVSDGFKKELELRGVGYRAQMKGKTLVLNVGYSNPVEFETPADLKLETPSATSIIVSGVSKQEVGDFAAQIRLTRAPEPYKGKGIRYVGEYVRRKEGKTGK